MQVLKSSLGFSGDEIKIYEHAVLKTSCTDTSRLRSQGEFCRMMYPLTPYVLHIGHDSYLMEKLTELKVINTVTVCRMFEDAISMLSSKVWTCPYNCSDHWRLPLAKMLHQRMTMYDVEFWKGVTNRVFDAADGSLIHGDPTLSNMMFRNGDLVLIDPIPTSNTVPKHWTVDVGKMLQSAIGWETLRLGWQYDKRDCIEEVMQYTKQIVRSTEMVWFWCAVHCVRIMPYAKTHPKVYSWAHSRADLILSYITAKEFDERMLINELCL